MPDDRERDVVPPSDKSRLIGHSQHLLYRIPGDGARDPVQFSGKLILALHRPR